MTPMNPNPYHAIKTYFADRQTRKDLQKKYEDSFYASRFSQVIYTREDARKIDELAKEPEHAHTFINDPAKQFIGKYAAQLEEIIDETNKEGNTFPTVHRDVIHILVERTHLSSIARELADFKKDGEKMVSAIDLWEGNNNSELHKSYEKLARSYLNTIADTTPNRHAQNAYVNSTIEFIKSVPRKGATLTSSNEIYSHVRDLIEIVNKSNQDTTQTVRYENIVWIAKTITADSSMKDYCTFMTDYLIPAARRDVKKTEEVFFRLAKEAKEDKSRFTRATQRELYAMAIDLLDDVKCGKRIK